MEASFDEQVNDILSKQKLEQKLNNQESLIEDYMRQYYKIQRKSTKDSKDRMMLYELESMIIQESINYTSIEDEYNNIQEQFIKVQNIKNQIKNLVYPIKDLEPDVVNEIIQNMVIVDYDQYISFINVSGKEMTPETIKNAVANPPLHTGIYNTKGKYDVEIRWSIVLC